MLSTTRVMADFLRIDSEMGLTFAGMALYTRDSVKRKRTTQLARKAFDTVMRMKINVLLTDAQSEKLEHNLGRLKGELESLGQQF